MKEEINYFDTDTDTDTKAHTNLDSRYPMPHCPCPDRLGMSLQLCSFTAVSFFHSSKEEKQKLPSVLGKPKSQLRLVRSRVCGKTYNY